MYPRRNCENYQSMTLKSFIPCFSSYLGELCVSYGVTFLLKVAFDSMQHKIVTDSVARNCSDLYLHLI